jgi:hypothetical protein
MDYYGDNWIYPQISFFFGLFWFNFNEGKPAIGVYAGINRFWGDTQTRDGEWEKARAWLERVKRSVKTKPTYEKI